MIAANNPSKKSSKAAAQAHTNNMVTTKGNKLSSSDLSSVNLKRTHLTPKLGMTSITPSSNRGTKQQKATAK